MIKFFRKIRLRLLSENKFSKPTSPTGRYILYAIGEIVLVVIGILIALQINNWNNEVDQRAEEQQIRHNLNTEFSKNQKELQAAIAHHEEIMHTIRDLMDLMGASELQLAQHNLDSLIAISLDYREYNPSRAVVADLLSSGKLNLIRSDSLRLLIYEWSSALDGSEEAYLTLDEIAQDLYLPYLTTNGSMRNIDRYSLPKWKQASRLYESHADLFQKVEFENVVDNQAWDVANYLNALQNLNIKMEEIITATTNEAE